MPRGVPRSGVRQPRTAPAPLSTPVEAVAGSAVDEPAGEPAPAALEASPVDTAADDPFLSQDPGELEVVPAPEPSEAEREIQRLRDELARLRGRRDEEPEVVPIAQPGNGDNILIHFLEDGLSALGRVWYRGEELEFEVGSPAYKDTFNRRGQTWLDLRHDEFAQVERFGKIMFRSGPWPGKTYLDGKFEQLRLEKGEGSIPPPSEDELAAAEKARKKRAAPRLPSQV